MSIIIQFFGIDNCPILDTEKCKERIDFIKLVLFPVIPQKDT